MVFSLQKLNYVFVCTCGYNLHADLCTRVCVYKCWVTQSFHVLCLRSHGGNHAPALVNNSIIMMLFSLHSIIQLFSCWFQISWSKSFLGWVGTTNNCFNFTLLHEMVVFLGHKCNSSIPNALQCSFVYLSASLFVIKTP